MKKFIMTLVSVLFIGGQLFAGGGGGISDPLVAAVNAAKIDTVKKELETETDVVARLAKKDDQGRTALMWAAYLNYDDDKKKKEEEGKRLDIIKLLIEKGSSLSAKDNDGWTSLMWASWSGMDDTVAVFIEKGADVSVAGKNGWTPLMLAASKGYFKITEALLVKGADKSAANKQNETALKIAEKRLANASDKNKDAFKKVVDLLK